MKDYGRGRGAKNRIAKAERKVAWNLAIREGRIVRFELGGSATIRSYGSPEAARIARDAAIEDGIEAAIVDPRLAE